MRPPPSLRLPAGSITGVVLDDSRHAIQGAVVYIRALNLGAVTAADGSFSLRGVPEGQYDVCVNYVGYEQICQNCNIRKEQTLHCEFLLHEGMPSATSSSRASSRDSAAPSPSRRTTTA